MPPRERRRGRPRRREPLQVTAAGEFPLGFAADAAVGMAEQADELVGVDRRPLPLEQPPNLCADAREFRRLR